MVQGFTRGNKFHPIGKTKVGVSEKEFANQTKDFIKIPKNHVFNRAITESRRNKLYKIIKKTDKDYEKFANDIVYIIDGNGKEFQGTRRNADIMELTGELITPFRKAEILLG